MHFYLGILYVFIATARIVTSAAQSETINSQPQPASKYVGYLLSTFTDVNPTVHFYLSNGNNPGSFSFANKGKPVLISSLGDKAVRDCFLAHNSARTKWYMIATGEHCTKICLTQKYRTRSRRVFSYLQISMLEPLGFPGIKLLDMEVVQLLFGNRQIL
jgi:hypothetical protein